MTDSMLLHSSPPLGMPDPQDAKEHLAATVALAQMGRKDAFEEVFKLTHNHARKLAYSVVGPDYCDDVVQESYLLVYRKLQQLKEPEAFLGWLCRLILHVAYRFSKKHPHTKQLPEHIGGDDRTDSVVDTLVLKRALDGLHHKDRDVLVLRELLGLNYEDISHTLQIPVGTVRSRLNKARKRLTDSLVSRGVGVPYAPPEPSRLRSVGQKPY